MCDRAPQTEFINNEDYTSLVEVYEILSKLYQKDRHCDSAFFYQQRYIEKKDSIFNEKKMTEVQNMAFNESLQDQQIAEEKKEAQLQYQNKIRYYIFGSVLLVILIIAFLQMRNLQITEKEQMVYCINKKKRLRNRKIM